MILSDIFFLTSDKGGYIILIACAGKCEVADTPIKVVITSQVYQVIRVEHCLSQILDERGNEHGKVKQDSY